MLLKNAEKVQQQKPFFESIDLFSLTEKDKFNKIILSNVLEHIDDRIDFFETVQKISEKNSDNCSCL